MDLHEYIKKYDKVFKTHIYNDIINKEFPMIEKIFYELGEELYIPSNKHKKLAEKKILYQIKF